MHSMASTTTLYTRIKLLGTTTLRPEAVSAVKDKSPCFQFELGSILVDKTSWNIEKRIHHVKPSEVLELL